MPRSHHPAPSTLRNRNRITNKSRLKIHHGNIDADPIIPDEDEEKNRFMQSVAGVDLEDANEHHLQAVLTEAASRNHPAARTGRGGDKSAPAAAYIPTPDSTGIIDNYEELYPANKWKDPATYIFSSATVEEGCNSALADGFTYYMDERDKEWLDKNNEEARGEGTSAQGAVSAGGTRASSRSAKAKGKDPEPSQPVLVTEDEFELVMGLFEKVTHEKTEFLHHSLETGMMFPSFGDYQDTFATPLPPSTFASFTVPPWIPPAAHVFRIARAIYPYWKERRLERGGHRIIPSLNGDEADTLNESYVCFRRREIKAVRKTRASQASSSDKLTRLQAELSFPLELARNILMRESLKQRSAVEAREIWDKRHNMVDMRRKNPALGDRADEELFIDRERPVRKAEPRSHGLRIPAKVDALPPVRTEASIRPKERLAIILQTVEAASAKQKEADSFWEDFQDLPTQSKLFPHSSRCFKYIQAPDAPSWPRPGSVDTDEDEEDGPPARKQSRPVRMRIGRGGRYLVDRRLSETSFPQRRGRALFNSDSDDDRMNVDEDSDDTERVRRLAERWRFDSDDAPPVGPSGPDEQDRILVDDYAAKHIRYTMNLLSDSDAYTLMTDPSLIIVNERGQREPIIPYRLGQAPMLRRPDPNSAQRASFPVPSQSMLSQGAQASSAGQAGPSGTPMSIPIPSNGTPISMAQQMKNMNHMRISANGGMRPVGVPVVASMQPPPVPSPQVSPPHTNLGAHHTPVNGTNGAAHPPANIPLPEPNTFLATSNGVQSANQQHQQQATQPQENHVNGQANSIVRPKSQDQPQMNQPTTNGYHVTPNMGTINGYPVAAAMNNNAQYLPHLNNQTSALSMQQVQNLKSVFASPTTQKIDGVQSNGGRPLPASYIHSIPNNANFNLQMGGGTNMNLKLPAARQMQWSGQTPLQRPGSVVNGLEGAVVNGGMPMSSSPNMGHAVPVRTPSANGMGGMRGPGHVLPNGQLNAHSLSPHHQHSPSPMPSIVQSQSPPRLPQTPTMAMVSPSMQHQQAQGGY